MYSKEKKLKKLMAVEESLVYKNERNDKRRKKIRAEIREIQGSISDDSSEITRFDILDLEE